MDGLLLLVTVDLLLLRIIPVIIFTGCVMYLSSFFSLWRGRGVPKNSVNASEADMVRYIPRVTARRFWSTVGSLRQWRPTYNAAYLAKLSVHYSVARVHS